MTVTHSPLLRSSKMFTDEQRLMFPILTYFEYKHLPTHLQKYSKPFAVLADQMLSTGINGPETAAGLRKLLEAKDCMVRAGLSKD